MKKLNKLFLLGVVFTSFLTAETFDMFLQRSIKFSPYLDASRVQLEDAVYQGKIELLYENPSFEMESSSFIPKVGSNSTGYKVGLTQPIRLWGVEADKKNYIKSIENTAKANMIVDKSKLVYNLSIQYIKYVQSVKLFKLSQKEEKITKAIYNIATDRYKTGATNLRGELLQSKIDYELASINTHSSNLEVDRNYNELFKLSGIVMETKIDTQHEFKLFQEYKNTLSPKQLQFKSLSDKASSLEKLNSNSIEWMNTFAEFEQEPDQKIVKVGISIPLAVFNDKSEERQLAKLNATKHDFFQRYVQTKELLDLQRLKKELTELRTIQSSLQVVLKSQLELLELFEYEYKIANINFIELQSIKNKVIETHRKIIDVQGYSQSNIIKQNYLNGAYNE